MTDYQAPVQQMRFTIEHLADFPAVTALPDFASVDGDTVEAVLEEAAKFAGGVLAPINWLGDQQGVKVVNDAVQVPQEFTDAYTQFCEAAGRASPRTPISAARACRRPSRWPATRCGRPRTSPSRCARSCRRARSSPWTATRPTS